MIPLGFFVDRDLAPAELIGVARQAEAVGFDSLWVIEDCFWGGGMTAAATVLASTERVHVGLGIAPAPLRNAALLAMETSVLCGAHPGRFTLGIGHGVQEWMGQAGCRVESPMTLLGEVTDAVAALLRGETVTTAGSHVHLDHVRLVHAPESVPDVLLGVRGPKGIALAGRLADGVILVEGTTPEMVHDAVGRMRLSRPPDAPPTRVVVFANVEPDPSRDVDDGTLGGSNDELVAAIDALAAAGATEVVLRPTRSLGEPAGVHPATRPTGATR